MDASDSNATDRVRIAAARLRVTTDDKQGLPTPQWVKDLAQGRKTMVTDTITEYALLYPSLIGGPLDDILPCPDKETAERKHKAWAKQGVKTSVVERTISAWTPTTSTR